MELSLKGFKDLLPVDMLAREKIMSVIKEIYESYGFAPLATPALEYKKTLLAYAADTKAIFTASEYERFLIKYPQAAKLIKTVTETFTIDEYGLFVEENPKAREIIDPAATEEDIYYIKVSELSLKQQQKLGNAVFEEIVERAIAGKQIYLFRDPDGKMVGLKFDLTVPLSRVIAEYNDLPRPFKRYQVQPVWRYDKPDPGRFREFTQFDIDTVGTASMAADTEIIAAMHDCLTKLNLNFKIRFSHRKIINSLLVFAEIDPENAHAVFRIMDKLDKLGLDAVKQELGAGRFNCKLIEQSLNQLKDNKVPSKIVKQLEAIKLEDYPSEIELLAAVETIIGEEKTERYKDLIFESASKDKIEGLGLNEDQINKIEQFLGLTQPSRDETIAKLEELFKDVDGANKGINELKEINEYLKALNISDERVIIDLSIARGLDYYTGPVFEAILTDEKGVGFGSVMGGGRYDQLIEHFLGESIPATGASIGVDRLLAAVQALGLIEAKPSTADVIITVMDKNKLIEYQKIAKMLRQASIKTELYLGKEKSIGKQLKYADKQRIPIAVIAGSNEFANQEVSIKDLRVIEEKKDEIQITDRKEWIQKRVGQMTIPMAELVETIQSILMAE